jgi:phosphoribosylformylglycinamidine synthase I
MATPKALVLRSAGTNCDRETEYALELAGFEASRVHLFRVMENPALLDDVQFLLFPGGFSYGDDVAAGKIFANQLLHHLAEPLNKFIDAGKCMLGICNGFQVMVKAGLLPWGHVDPAGAHKDATLAWNDCGQFVDKWVHLRCDSDACVFLPKGEVVALPMAHGEGKFIPRDEATLEKLVAGDQIGVRYVDATGQAKHEGGCSLSNPNGSVSDIAGICDPTGRVMGLMPHPERFTDITHHPQWTRGDVQRADGRLFFDNAFRFLSQS